MIRIRRFSETNAQSRTNQIVQNRTEKVLRFGTNWH